MLRLLRFVACVEALHRNQSVASQPHEQPVLKEPKRGAGQKYLLVFSDIFMNGMSGLDLLKEVKEAAPQIKVVVMTAQDTMNNTIEAMRMGAYDYISKPFDLDAIYTLVDRAESSRGIQVSSKSEEVMEVDAYSVKPIVGKSKKMRNDFGKTISKFTNKKEKDATKLGAALKKAVAEKNADKVTFESLIKAGKLPGKAPATP